MILYECAAKTEGECLIITLCRKVGKHSGFLHLFQLWQDCGEHNEKAETAADYI